jgi:hypothetical protein
LDFKNYSMDRIVVSVPRSKGSVLLARHPIEGGKCDEDTMSTSTPAAHSRTPAPATPSSAPPSGPITRARAREFNFVMMQKNEGPKD